MASPQTDNGYTRIANELMEAFARAPSMGSESFQVLMFVLRYTYGFQRKSAQLSKSFIAKGTGLRVSGVSRALKRLVSKRILAREKSTVSFNKNYEQWLVSKRRQSPIGDTSSPQSETTASPQSETQERKIHKEKLKKPERASIDAPEINQIIEKFSTINPGINYGNKTERTSAKWLVDTYGLDGTLDYIDYAISISSEKYAPIITTPYQLRAKLGELKIFYDKKTKSRVTIV